MCIRRRKLYSCSHSQERILICPVAQNHILYDPALSSTSLQSMRLNDTQISPNLDKSRFLKSHRLFNDHNVHITCESPLGPCPECILPDINIFTLEVDREERRQGRIETVTDGGLGNDGLRLRQDMAAWHVIMKQLLGVGYLAKQPWVERGHVVFEMRASSIQDSRRKNPADCPDQKRMSKL